MDIFYIFIIFLAVILGWYARGRYERHHYRPGEVDFHIHATDPETGKTADGPITRIGIWPRDGRWASGTHSGRTSSVGSHGGTGGRVGSVGSVGSQGGGWDDRKERS